ncbi:hypothetical protein [Nocardia salmonicida]|uniref:hypothetical protein n=1 Tax=Nocardia salmonicida TaxID=53431 RepID=UPI000AFEF228|nr:hypothetical protein [Nocardia salmonicida]MBC7303188.1 hypothetical protein [Nocardia sp.]
MSENMLLNCTDDTSPTTVAMRPAPRTPRTPRPVSVSAELLAQLDLTEPPPRVVASWGLGADSTALLHRMIANPALLGCRLDEIAVVVAMVGDEWTQTGLDASEVVLPILARHRVRTIQVGRRRRKVFRDGRGVRVFSDTRTPRVLHFSGEYRLSDEMIAAGTIPQTGGARLCSVHAKGEILDPTIAAITGGHPYRHLIGFEATESGRALKDTRYNTAARTGEYPLLDWGWDRPTVESYLLKTTGRQWQKSACVFCPYSLATMAGRAATFDRYRRHPAAGARMLWLEHIALALNERQGLIAGKRAIDHVRADGGLDVVLDQFGAALAEGKHAVYELRRLTKPARDPAKKGVRWRAVRALGHGSRTDMLAWLNTLPGTTVLGDDGIARRVVRDGTHPDDHHAEHFFVAAPAGVGFKKRAGFERHWRAATHARRRAERHHLIAA